jgi:hypothetical protein
MPRRDAEDGREGWRLDIREASLYPMPRSTTRLRHDLQSGGGCGAAAEIELS